MLLTILLALVFFSAIQSSDSIFDCVLIRNSPFAIIVRQANFSSPIIHWIQMDECMVGECLSTIVSYY